MTEMLPYIAIALVLLIWFRVERISSQVSQVQETLFEMRRELGLTPKLSLEPSNEVRNLASDPDKTIEAIKTYRMQSGADLKTAKNVVEQLGSARSDA